MAKGDAGSVWLGPLGVLTSGQDPPLTPKRAKGTGQVSVGVAPGPEGSTTNSLQHPRLSPGCSCAQSQGLQAGRRGVAGSRTRPTGHQLGFQERARRG